MKNVQEKIIKSVYRTYGFVEEDITKFSEIALDGINEDIEYEKGILKAKANLVNYIIDEIKNNGFLEVFNKTVDKVGIHKTFAIYDLVIYDADMQIDPEDIFELSRNEKYQEFYEKVKKTNNYLLKSVLEAYNPDMEEVENIPEIYVGPLGDPEVTEYFKSIQGIPILDRREEQELIKKYRNAQDEDDKQELKDEFIWHYLGLAASYAAKYKRQRPTVKLSLLDLIQEGNTGLVIAFDKWNENFGYRFSTYAMWWIKQTLDRSVQNLNDTIRIPVWLWETIDKKNSFIISYVNEHNRTPSEKEVMEHLGINEENYDSLLKAETVRTPLSLDAEIEDEDTLASRQSNMQKFIADENIQVEEDSIAKYTRKEILKVFDEVLEERESKIIRDYFGFNKSDTETTLEELGNQLGITRERARQIKEKAMDKLQQNSKKFETPDHKPTGRITSKADLKTRLLEQNMKIKIIQYQTKTNTALFECKECGNRFNEESNILIERGSCPFCAQSNKQLIKKIKED